jgi:hypothetical protein
MAGNIKVLDPDTGAMVDGVVVRVVKTDEPFSHFTLEDETEVSIRITVSRVVRLLGRWNDDKEPKYTFTFNVSTTTVSPSALKKDGGANA